MTLSVLASRHGRAGRPRRGGLFWHRDFRLFWIGQTASKLGSSVTSIALPLVAVATLDASTFEVATLSAAVWLPWLLIGLPAGAWVDRFPRRPVMVSCDLASLVLFLSVPVAAWMHQLTLVHLFAVAVGAGTASVFFHTAHQVYLPSLLDRRHVGEGNAKLHATEEAAHIGGPGVAGVVAQVAGAVNALLIDVASFAVSAICLLSMRHRESTVAKEPHRSLRRDIGEGVRFVARDPFLRVLAVFGASSNIGLIGYQAILVVFLVREVGVSPGVVGALAAAPGVGGIAGAVAATALARRFGSARTLVAAEMGGAPFGLLIPLTTPHGLAFAAVGGLLIGAGVAIGNVLKGTFRQTYTPHEMLGRTTVSMQLVNYGTIPFGALLGGGLGATLGVRPAMWIMAVGVALAPLALLVGPMKRSRDFPDHPGQDRAADGPGGDDEGRPEQGPAGLRRASAQSRASLR